MKSKMKLSKLDSNISQTYTHIHIHIVNFTINNIEKFYVKKEFPKRKIKWNKVIAKRERVYFDWLCDILIYF